MMTEVENRVLIGDALKVLKTIPDESVQCCVTSPPYWGQRDYRVVGQIGREKNPIEYVLKVTEIFREVRRVMKADGTAWINMGDSYSRASSVGRFYGSEIFRLKPKDLTGLPWMIAFALRSDGWHLRSDIIFSKPNAMPESVRDRPTKSHEYVFLLSKSEKYFYDVDAVREPFIGQNEHDRTGGRYSLPGQSEHSSRRNGSRGGYVASGRNRRTVWSINTKSYKGAHFATFPEKLPEICILAGSAPGDLILDPFAGSGTTCAVAKRLGRKFLGIELNAAYAPLFKKRIAEAVWNGD